MPKTPSPEAHTFFVDTRFQRLARRPGGVPREVALESAQNNIDQSTPDFEIWLDAELQTLATVVRNAEAGIAEPGWPEDVCSRCRQLRDLGTTMGFVLLTFVASNLCEILDGTPPGHECDMETITCHLDALFLARQQQYRHMRLEDVPELTKGLRLVKESVSISPDAAPK
jgi:hypothetical protein